MKINPNDGAFPPVRWPQRDWHPDDVKLWEQYGRCGLTKREYFAALAMQGLCANPNTELHYNVCAQYAIQYVDALIAELNK